MGQNFLIELFAQNDGVLTIFGRRVAPRAAVIPNLCLPQECESHHMNDACPWELAVGSKEDRGAENPFKGANQPSIFFAALVHSEGVEHFRTTLETDRLALLPDGKSGQEDRHDSVLSERETVVGMPGHLQNEMSVPPLEKKLTRWRTADRETAENERPRAESEILFSLIPVQTDQLDSVELSKYLPRDL